MEWLDLLRDLISNLGFPIVVCGALFWYINKHTEKQHEEMQELRDTVERNTDIIKDLKDLISLVINNEKK